MKLIKTVICLFTLAPILIQAQGGGTISAARPVTVGAINGKVYIGTLVLGDANVAAVSETLREVYVITKTDRNGDFFLAGLPADTPLRVYTWKSDDTENVNSFRVTLSKGEILTKNIYLATNHQTFTLATRRAGNARVEQIEYLVNGPKYTEFQTSDPWAKGFPIETKHFNRLKGDIEEVEYIDDNGVVRKTWAPYNIASDRILFRRMFESAGSMIDYTSRKEYYKMALYEIAWQDGLDILNFMGVNNGTTTLQSVNQAMEYLNTFIDAGSMVVAAEKVTQMLANFKSLQSAGTAAEFGSMVKHLDNQLFSDGLKHFNGYLSVLSAAVNVIRIGDAAVSTFLAPTLLHAAQYELAYLRMSYLAQFDLIDDIAYKKALEEILESYETIPSEYWEKMNDLINRNKTKIEQGIYSSANLFGDVLAIMGGGPYAGWVKAVLYTHNKIRSIGNWNDEFRKMICTANIYGHFLDVQDRDSWLSRDIIEYTAYNYYNTFSMRLQHPDLKIWEILKRGQRDLREYMERERDILLTAIVSSRVEWYANTFPEIPASENLVIGLILDSSGSMRQTDPNNIRISASQAIIDILSGTEKVYIIDFDHSAVWRNPDNYESWDAEKLKAEIAKVGASGGTSIEAGLKRLETAVESSITGDYIAGALLLSDGKSRYPSDLTWYKNNNVPIYAVSYKQYADASLLSKIAGETGGIYIQANNEADVVRAFQSFYNDMFKNSRLVSCSDKIKAGESASLCSFLVDPGSNELIGTLSWQSGELSLKMKSPGGKEFSRGLTPGQVIEGNNYTIVRIRQPEGGEWSAEAINKGSGDAFAEFVFEVSGNSSVLITLEKTANDGFIGYRIYEPEGKLDLASIKPSITIETPGMHSYDISGSYSKGSFQYFPRQGQGTYITRMSFLASLTDGAEIQRHFIVSDYIGNYIPPFISSPTSAEGGILKAPLGVKSGNYVGMKCYIYAKGSNRDNPKAIGMVTMVTENECFIDIMQHISSEPITTSDIIELDKVQWQNDENIRIN